ncbi:ABC transporter permease subunit [Clostridium lacusfryxellense]|uniref:ABC transporter permease subunit n=1 Tax=Clostridium lacusfryxellense TaxID=205328 RepID=UPI001C0B1F38|nr:ABC transporter permease subunit [Clostridium lacusfryxellense]MBU3111480.1 ABC transporter permease subunit [Clostridium lacusfryxellense]
MNKIVNKALFYKEWINVKWVTFLTIIVLFYFKVQGVMSVLNQNKITMRLEGKVWTDRWFNNGLYKNNSYFFVMVFVVVILTIILFLGEKTSETQGFIASLPFTRKQILLNKWFVGVLCLLISFVVAFIVLSLVYVINFNNLDATLNPYSDIVKWFLIDTLQYICIFTFMVLAQSFMGNSIVAGIVGAIILIVPAFIATVVQDVIVRGSNVSGNIYIIYDKVYSWSLIYTYNLTDQKWVNTEPNSGKEMYRTFYYTNYKLKLLILFILTCLFLYLAHVSYKKRNLEYNLRLIVFKNLEPVFSWGFAVCLGLFAGFSFKTDLSVFFILVIAFTILGYFLSKLLLKVLSSTK